MRHLEIYNFGPINHVSIDLKRFNIIIGPQSSGKSTIVKVLSTCTWIEKEVHTTLNDNVIQSAAEFEKLLSDFHKMADYFENDTHILYETDYIHIEYLKGAFRTVRKSVNEYQRNKICYIPAERNMVTLPELQGFEFGQTNLRSFLFDWFNAREYFVADNKTDVLNLGVKYYYDDDEKKQKDRIEHINGKTYHIALSSASSGLQSVIPLLVMMQYYTGEYFNSYAEKVSFDVDSKIKKTRRVLIDELVLNHIKPNFSAEERPELVKLVNDRVHEHDERYVGLVRNFWKVANRLTIPSKSSFIIEEPEQNLYPSTQMDLLKVLISLCQGDKEHDLTITTHSPYILNQLNLLVKLYDVNSDDEAKLNWEELTVFAVEDGGLRDLKLKNAHLINPEYLSAPLDAIYDQYERL